MMMITVSVIRPRVSCDLFCRPFFANYAQPEKNVAILARQMTASNYNTEFRLLREN